MAAARFCAWSRRALRYSIGVDSTLMRLFLTAERADPGRFILHIARPFSSFRSSAPASDKAAALCKSTFCRDWYIGDLDDDLIPGNTDREALHRLACITDSLPDIDAKPVQWTVDRGSIERTFTQRTAGVRTAVVDDGNATADSKDRNP